MNKRTIFNRAIFILHVYYIVYESESVQSNKQLFTSVKNVKYCRCSAVLELHLIKIKSTTLSRKHLYPIKLLPHAYSNRKKNEKEFPLFKLQFIASISPTV